METSRGVDCMIQPHIIALDLDGTLLAEHKYISDRNKQALKKAREKGHKVVISTGRPFRSSQMYYDELELDTPIVNFNGSYTHHPKDKSFGIHHSPIELTTAKKILHSIYDLGMENVFAEVVQDVYAHKMTDELQEIFMMKNGRLFEGKVTETLDVDPTCLLLSLTEDNVATFRNYLTEMHTNIIEHRSWGAPYHIVEISKSGVNKASGLQKVSSYYNIPKERIIAFGDEDNDMEMIEYAGYGIAMGNGIDELKSIAREVTLSNEEDGIAVYLEQLLKL